MCAKYYESPTMLSRVIAENVRDVFFFETHCICVVHKIWTLSFKCQDNWGQLGIFEDWEVNDLSKGIEPWLVGG